MFMEFLLAMFLVFNFSPCFPRIDEDLYRCLFLSDVMFQFQSCMFVSVPIGFSYGSPMFDFGSLVFDLVSCFFRSLELDILNIVAPSAVGHQELVVLLVYGVLAVSLRGHLLDGSSGFLVLLVTFFVSEMDLLSL